MEHMLRCNSLKCRKELGNKALVTTCSHIFCTDCATRLGLTNPSGRHSCPACSSPWTNPDDVVVTNLNPSEDYKTSVLSGLSPNVIIECASRALSFWAYQTIQEVVYQEYLGKTLTEKYTNLTVHLDKVIGDANAQITSLNNKISDLNLDQQALRRRNDELSQAFKEKNKKLIQTWELYDKLKRKAMMGQMQHAAEDAVDSNLNSVTCIGTNVLGPEEGRLSPGCYPDPGAAYQNAPTQQPSILTRSNAYPVQATNQPNSGPWDGSKAGVMGGTTEVPITPSTHRQRIGGPSGIALSTVPGIGQVDRSPRHGINTRAPLNDISSNIRNTERYSTTGLSLGLKASHNASVFNDFAAPTIRSQVQQPAQVLSGIAQGIPSHHPESVLGDIRSASINGAICGGFTSR